MAQREKLYRIGARSGSYDYTRPPTPHHRLLCTRIWNDDRRRMGSTNGRLARAQRAARRNSWFCDRGPAAAARWLCLRPMGTAPSGRRRRSCLHRAGLSTDCELFHWLDDAAGVLHRLPVGSGGTRKTCSVHFSVAEFVRIVPSGGGTRSSSASFSGRGGVGVFFSVGLSGDPRERPKTKKKKRTRPPVAWKSVRLNTTH